MSAAPPDGSPFHDGERAVQSQSGVHDQAERLGGRMLRQDLGEPQRAFFEQLFMLVIGSVDGAGQPWASLLFGPPGFVRVPEPRRLIVRAVPASVDPLARGLQPGAALGLLGIELHTRRRNRVNGRVSAVSAAGFELAVDQSFGNCPKYIQQRWPQARPQASPPTAATPEGPVLSARALTCIARAGTAFIASASSAPDSQVAGGVHDPREGADVSHRGGEPGFVQRLHTPRGTLLIMPDYPGNNMFNTLGNLARYPRAGLLFPDFDSGAVLLVACDAAIAWRSAADPAAAGAARALELQVRGGWFIADYLPIR